MTSQKIRINSMTKLQKRHKRQQRNRRGNIRLKKAYELSIMANAEVFLGIRFRDTGRVKTSCADTTGIWPSHLSHLVSKRLVKMREILNYERMLLLLTGAILAWRA